MLKIKSKWHICILRRRKILSNRVENISFLDFDRLFGTSHRVIFLKSSVFLRKKAFKGKKVKKAPDA